MLFGLDVRTYGKHLRKKCKLISHDERGGGASFSLLTLSVRGGGAGEIFCFSARKGVNNYKEKRNVEH